MQRALALISTLALVACAQSQSPNDAARLAQSDLISIGGDGELVEVQRAADFSIIEVRSSPRGSVVSSLFVLRGACAVLRARGATFVRSEAVPAAVSAYRLTFPNAASPSEISGPTKSVFTRTDCSALRL